MKMLLLLYLSLAVVVAMAPLKEDKEKVKSAPELLEQSQNVVPKKEPEVEAKIKPEGEVQVEAAVKPEGEVKVEAAVKPEGEVKVEAGVEPEGEVKEAPGVEPEGEVESEGEPEVSNLPEGEPEPGLVGDPDFQVESEVKVDPALLERMEPKERSNEAQGALEKLNLEAPEADQTLDEEQGGMETAVLEDPAVDQEQEDDDMMSEEEPGLADKVNEVRPRAYDPVEEPNENFEGGPESLVPEYGEDGPALGRMEEKMQSMEESLPNEEARVEELRSNFAPVGREKAVAGLEEEVGEVAQEEAASKTATSKHYCPGVVLYGKCYQFFKQPRRAEQAEFFCQQRFRGHLASITSAFAHRELMKLILRQNGRYTRTWIGGLRYLQTNHFIWLDGSQWQYEDWLAGEPNPTSGLEHCVEVLPWGNGKFNDFTCWTPQAFICSYPYH